MDHQEVLIVVLTREMVVIIQHFKRYIFLTKVLSPSQGEKNSNDNGNSECRDEIFLEANPVIALVPSTKSK